MSFTIRNLDWLRKLAPQNFGDIQQLGARLYEAMQSVQMGVRNIEAQTSSDSTNHPAAPPPLDGLNVTAANGIFHASITHNAEFYRGIRYHLEYADNANFTNPFPVDMGTAREWRGSLGNLNLHFRAAASYGISPPTNWTYFGSQSSPTSVAGGGSAGPSLPSQSQGSGTGLPGQGLQGPGQTAYRSASGAPPVRTQKTGQP